MLLGDTLNTLKIADFGLAKDVGSNLSTGVGTTAYIAPEVFDSEKYCSSADVYSLAVSAWEMFHRKVPYYQQAVNGYMELLKKISTEKLRLKIETDIEEEMKEVILNCFHSEPSNRPKIKDIIKLSIKLGKIDTDEQAALPNEQVALPKLCKGSFSSKESAPLMHQTIWTEEDREILRNGQIDTDEQVKLGPAPLMCQTIWTEEEKEILRNGQIDTDEQVKLGPAPLMCQTIWTEEEKEILRNGQTDTDEQVKLGPAPLMCQTMWTEEEREILAKTIFGVARGECLEGQHAVGHVVLNRKKTNKSYWGGDTVIGVCKKKYQFACWNGKESVAITSDERRAYEDIFEWVPDLLEGRIRDPTEGCDHFSNPSHQPYPDWIEQARIDRKKMVDIGNHRFYQIGH